jgi:ABC-type Na+ efflux pump permease subunit
MTLGLLTSSPKLPSPLQTAYQFVTLLALPLVFTGITSPDSPLMKVLSYVPVTAPYGGMVRANMSPTIEWWEIALSLGGLIVCAMLAFSLTLRVFRALVMVRDERVGFRKLIKLIVDPNSES